MPRYRVYMKNVVSFSVEVEAEGKAAAMDQAEMEGLPGLMMLDHRYPDESGWEVDEAELIPEVES